MTGAANITASGKGTFGGEVEAGAWVHARNGYGDVISLGGTHQQMIMKSDWV